MAHIDPSRRTLDLKLVYWGPAAGGKTTSLRSVHGACDPSGRGALSSVDTEDERTYFFDYAPLDLPTWRGLSVRAHAYTVPGQDAYVETRKRILRGADAVVFVADATPARVQATTSSWRQLDDALRIHETTGPRTPVVLAANKQDLPSAASGAEVARRLAEAGPRRAPVDVVETTAVEGSGVVRGFSAALVAAASQAVEGEPGGAGGEGRRFAAALAERFGSPKDGVPVSGAPTSRTVKVPVSSRDPDAGGLVAALETSRWLAVGDAHQRSVAREQALRKLLVDVSRACLAAEGHEAVARGVLATLVGGLDAAGGWMLLADARGSEQAYDPMGAMGSTPSVLEQVRAAALELPEGHAISVTLAPEPGSPGGAALVAPVASGSARHGFLVVLARPGTAAPADAEPIVGSAGALVALAAQKG
jgi:signal recognition particle receptor subunit beta